MATRKKASNPKGKAKSARKGAAKRSAKTSAKSSARRSAKSSRTSKPTGLQLSSQAPSLTVDDVHKSIAWYTETLGFTITQRWEHEGKLHGVELKAGGVIVYLSQEDGSKGPRTKGQGFRIYWYTNGNIDKIAAGIRSRGGQLATEPKDEWGTRYFNLVDPTGYLITVSSER